MKRKLKVGTMFVILRPDRMGFPVGNAIGRCLERYEGFPDSMNAYRYELVNGEMPGTSSVIESDITNGNIKLI